MKYELQTTLGVILDAGDSIDQVIERFRNAMRAVLSDAQYAGVAAHRVVLGDRPLEIVVGILFTDGVRAEYADDMATEILDQAITRFRNEEKNSREDTQVSEESVRLQSVYA
ncbi:hypothetical protein Leucomu_13580 [Leucobacter muris]|uniref:Uncharacterized protein n=1 Tax=Leucobacter muris TaxID=1935379 RepID=A0ABX5QIP6_9MICO|nr:hypothetical protein [Leucobacter muris]QAB18804.1 hypothetical protein Leucomu_13580 [Leucobacter muris]